MRTQPTNVKVCVLVSRLFQSEGDLRLEFVKCSVHVIKVTSGSIHNAAQETWQVPSTFCANLLRSESMMFMKQGLFPILLSCNGVGVTISVDLSRCQVANHLRFLKVIFLLCTMVNHWLNIIKPPFGRIFFGTFSKHRRVANPSHGSMENDPFAR